MIEELKKMLEHKINEGIDSYTKAKELGFDTGALVDHAMVTAYMNVKYMINKLEGSKMTIDELIHKCELNDACKPGIEWVSQFETVEELAKCTSKIGYLIWIAKNVIRGRWPDAEDAIKTAPEWAYYYAKYVIKGRWLEAEDVIKTSPEFVFLYAKYIIRGRWPEAEGVIKTEAEWALRYAEYVIRGEWEK